MTGWISAHNDRGEIEGFEPAKAWRLYNALSHKVCELHTDERGHVTVVCYCPRCEAEREKNRDQED